MSTDAELCGFIFEGAISNKIEIVFFFKIVFYFVINSASLVELHFS